MTVKMQDDFRYRINVQWEYVVLPALTGQSHQFKTHLAFWQLIRSPLCVEEMNTFSHDICKWHFSLKAGDVQGHPSSFWTSSQTLDLRSPDHFSTTRCVLSHICIFENLTGALLDRFLLEQRIEVSEYYGWRSDLLGRSTCLMVSCGLDTREFSCRDAKGFLRYQGCPKKGSQGVNSPWLLPSMINSSVSLGTSQNITSAYSSLNFLIST